MASSYNKDGALPMKKLHEILEGCRKNDSKCQQLVFNNYKSLFLSIAMRYTGERALAKDVVQVSFLRIFDNINKLDNDKNFEAWARKIVVNTALNEIKKKKRNFDDRKEFYESQSETIPDWETDLIRKIDTKYLLELINEMPEGYRTVFNLYLIEGYSHLEIAEMTGISEGTSRSQLFKAKRYFRDLIQNLNSENYGKTSSK